MSKIKRSPPKRLIVCCDGTWQDSLADAAQPPSNVTRFSRVLSRMAIVQGENGEQQEIPQIVYYQKGAGTNLGDRYWGGVAGLGVSANVRSAYGFLADNYAEGDKIYFFGFSRGAYTARAIAGLVCQWGLLTPRGMDNFPTVYDDFYNNQIEGYTPAQRTRMGFRDRLPRFTVEIIGVWDTVGFQKAWLGRDSGEKLELRNTVMHEDVRYGFHALSLDEERTAFQPALWHVPKENEGQEFPQVWFSGVHTDIGGGGGGDEPRLSNITLAWMIAQCMKNDQLSFDIDEYLFDIPPRARESDSAPWATSLGGVDHASFTRTLQRWLGGRSNRTPLRYNPPGQESDITNEWIHESVKDRNLSKWPCAALKGRGGDASWTLADGKEIQEFAALEKEKYMKGRIRTVHVNEED
ncbi:T6SS phospholipase effector Tle1-like catalytic domain-containing protein [Aspergillus clavatus NRRL 1]|uniref:T6SS Phospholipase effector Tle1-like catalytic domain-containing protein n=1 Tax=Aspergillus clavatus (strain ATCC 1007 / CBS 513.65 / DSM 816 / NCTC 3887 / NRRL 1 / QM 1276 / 107) TaxID=344612 RepID=A1CCU5_ASPCL|nr:uncharacterized protein ACLA_063190 [Aspergillus clavatus NRRL 1]EAW12352.1 conserved hypothetical protein [Aspergillus clavatus NRRL 1]